MVEFCGFSHDPLNLDITPYIEGQFSQHLSERGTNTTFFFESAQGTPEDTEHQKRVIDKYGYRAFLIASVLDQDDDIRLIGNKQLVDQRIAEIEGALDQGQWRVDLLPIRKLQLYFLYRSFDKLKDQYSFSFDRETHTPGVIKKAMELRAGLHRFFSLADTAWNEGKFDDFKRFADSYNKLTQAGNKYRDDETSEALRKKVNKLLETPDGGSIFILMGRNHARVLDPLKKKFNKGNVEFKQSGGSSESLDRLTPVQKYLSTVIFDKLMKEYVGQERGLEFGYKFTVTQHQIEELIAGVSEPEIKALCETKADLLAFIRGKGLTA